MPSIPPRCSERHDDPIPIAESCPALEECKPRGALLIFRTVWKDARRGVEILRTTPSARRSVLGAKRIKIGENEYHENEAAR
jgi:hypothetical protein